MGSARVSSLLLRSPLFGVAAYLVGMYGLTSNKRNLVILLVCAEVVMLGIIICLS